MYAGFALPAVADGVVRFDAIQRVPFHLAEKCEAAIGDVGLGIHACSALFQAGAGIRFEPARIDVVAVQLAVLVEVAEAHVESFVEIHLAGVETGVDVLRVEDAHD